MNQEDRSMLVLALAAIIALLLLFFFRWVLEAIFVALGMLLCCFLTVVAIIAFIALIATLFSLPFFAKKYPKKEYYGEYRIEEIKGMDEDEENRR